MSIDYATLRDAVKDGGYVYLATPYSRYEGGLDAAWKEACKVAAALIRAGIPVYCPIAHKHPIAEHGGGDKQDHKKWPAICQPCPAICPRCLFLEIIPLPNYGPAIRL